jgi:hypothetical protein
VHSESAPDGAPLIDWSRQNLLFGVDRNVRTAAREVGKRLAIDLVEREQEPSSIGFSGADATGGTVSVNENRVDPFGFLSAEGLAQVRAASTRPALPTPSSTPSTVRPSVCTAATRTRPPRLRWTMRRGVVSCPRCAPRAGQWS